MKLFASIWHKAKWMIHQMKFELIRIDFLVSLTNYYNQSVGR